MSEWTPLAHAAACRCSACDPTHPESVVDALREENERLRKLHQEAVEILCQKDERVGTLRARVEELEVERDEARAEVERLGTALRRLCEEAFHAAAPMTDDGPPLLPALWRELQRANDAHMATGGGSQEPRPDTARMVAAAHSHPNSSDRDHVAQIAPTLMAEEATELLIALHEGDRAHIARELADVVYVAYSAAWAHGIDLDAALTEINRAMVDKLDANVRRESDGKILKPPGFVPPDMTAAIGEKPRPDTDETCPNCGGRGRVRRGPGMMDGEVVCPACKGSGRRPDTKET